MKTHLHTLILAGVAGLSSWGCGLVLDDPAPFVITHDAAVPDAEPDANPFMLDDPDYGFRPDDARVPPDAQPRPDMDPSADAEIGPDGDLPDMALTDEGLIDEGVTDMLVVNPPDMDPGAPDMLVQPDAFVDAGPGPCVPSQERCNGGDDDCDGQIDEDDPSLCTPCGVADATGVCGFGALDCQEGELICQRWLPPTGEAIACDLQDNDCDGAIDEGPEITPARSPAEAAIYDRCGPDPRTTLEAPTPPCAVDPRVVGCNLAHACVPSACRQSCERSRLALFVPCFAQCPDQPPLARGNCIGGCREAVEQAHVSCLEACNDDPNARYTCEDGPICAPLDP